jgi:hypothetical protein
MILFKDFREQEEKQVAALRPLESDKSRTKSESGLLI